MISIDLERPQDITEIENLLDAAFGPDRSEKSSYKLRENNPALERLSFVVRLPRYIAATVRFTPVHIFDSLSGNHMDALFLGPLAVLPAMQSKGIGSALMHHALQAVDRSGFSRVLLVGDASYYHRFGFEGVGPRYISLPGGGDEKRLLLRQLATSDSLPMQARVLPGWSSPRQMSSAIGSAA